MRMAAAMKATTGRNVSRFRNAANWTTKTSHSQSPSLAGLSIVHFCQSAFHMISACVRSRRDLLLSAAFLLARRLAAIASAVGRILRARPAIALDHRPAAAFEGIVGAVLLDVAADVLARAPGAFIDVTMTPAEQHALVLEKLRGGRADVEAERHCNGKG